MDPVIVGGLLAGGFTIGAVVITSVLTAHYMMGVAERQIEAAQLESRAQALREERRSRVADLRTLLADLASAATRLMYETTIKSGKRMTAIKEKWLADQNLKETPENVRRFDEIVLQIATGEEERPGQALLDLLQMMPRGHSIVPPGPVAGAWNRLLADWLIPTTASAATKALTYRELSALGDRLDEVHKAIDQFVVSGRAASEDGRE